ncbi:MAG: hypothetical protein U0164_04995 [Gemmatimonadaceae bacterium]
MRTLLRSTLAALALCAGSAACGTILDLSPASSQSVLGTEAMRLQLSKTTVNEGDVLPLTVTLTNTTSAAVTYQGNTCPFNVFEVQDAAGERIDPRIELILCAAYSQPVQLAPGASTTWSLEWIAARYAPSRASRPPGTQTVRLRARYWIGKQLVASEWQSVAVKQAP